MSGNDRDGISRPAGGSGPGATFENKAALVFGSGLNIGRAVAREFAGREARVAVADIDVAGANETVRLIKESGGEAVALSCDVTNLDSVRAAVSDAEARLGDLDIVMNNVGVLHSGYPEDIPLAEWERSRL